MADTDNLKGTSWWAGSDEYGPWTQAPAVRVLAEYPSESFAHLVLVETDEPNPRQFVFGIGWPEALPEPGRPLSARVFHPPEHWDGHSPLNLGALPFHSEAIVAARPEDAPRISAEALERRRKGWF